MHSRGTGGGKVGLAPSPLLNDNYDGRRQVRVKVGVSVSAGVGDGGVGDETQLVQVLRTETADGSFDLLDDVVASEHVCEEGELVSCLVFLHYSSILYS